MKNIDFQTMDLDDFRWIFGTILGSNRLTQTQIYHSTKIFNFKTTKAIMLNLRN
jgi:hypothetical protein